MLYRSRLRLGGGRGRLVRRRRRLRGDALSLIGLSGQKVSMNST